MCGIVGIASTGPVTERAWLGVGAAALRHRGPDDAGEWWSADGRVGLAHRRLSILDLSSAGRQPMAAEEGELQIVYNGEIYNFAELRKELEALGHVFRTATDTEVILAAYRTWGTRCLERLNGMFAFALCDGIRRRVFLARDRAGEKPLYYSVAGETLRFASEMKALLADPQQRRCLDPAAFDYYFYRGYPPSHCTLLRGISKLPPAHALLFDLESGAMSSWRYWQPPPPCLRPMATAREERALVDEAEALLEAAVRRQLVADVPVGILLSGGVDSSLVTALAVRAAARVKTFTVRFPGHRGFDETAHARLIARHFDTEHAELEASSASPDLMLTLGRQFDTPIFDSGMVPAYLVYGAIRDHCKVALGGDGGDELFGGYPHHSGLAWMRERLGWIPRVLRREVARSSARLAPAGMRGRRWFIAVGAELDHGPPPNVAAQFDLAQRRSLLRDPARFPFEAESAVVDWDLPDEADLVERAARADFCSYFPEDILIKVDRTSMLNSLETRAPMLDLPFMEFALGRVPARLKASATDRKILLKRLSAKLLPDTFDLRRKQGFSIPIDAWLAHGPWRAFIEQVLRDAGGDSPFEPRALRQLLDGQARGRRNGERLFGLALFEIWRREYRITL